MRRVLIISNSDINTDPRVLRQIKFFSQENFDVFLCGNTYHGKFPFFKLTRSKSLIFRALKLSILVLRLNKLRVYEFLHHTPVNELLKIDPTFDFIVANDAPTWPVAVKLKKAKPTIKLIFDAHEQYAKEFSDLKMWNWFHKGYANYLCSNYIPFADEFLTVCEGIAIDYKTEYGVNSHVVLNTPDFESELLPNAVGDCIQLVHHGIANRSRYIEKIIRMMDFLDSRFQLNLLLMPVDPSYYAELKKLSEGKNIKFLNPVATEEISKFINQFDIGVFLLEPINFNYTYALPNKFFEFIQARLAIAIGPSIEMKRIVELENIGIVSPTFEEEELANQLKSIDKEQILQMKLNSHQVAEKYSNNQNSQIFRKIISKHLL